MADSNSQFLVVYHVIQDDDRKIARSILRSVEVVRTRGALSNPQETFEDDKRELLTQALQRGDTAVVVVHSVTPLD